MGSLLFYKECTAPHFFVIFGHIPSGVLELHDSICHVKIKSSVCWSRIIFLCQNLLFNYATISLDVAKLILQDKEFTILIACLIVYKEICALYASKNRRRGCFFT